MTKTAYLVNAGNDKSMASIANDYSFPPLNILAFGTWLQQETPEIEVTCRDAGIVGTARICAEIRSSRPWWVGVGVLATSCQSALQIAAAAKSVGAWTVFGNNQAAHMSRLIIEHCPNVDFVVGAEYGEQTLSALVLKLLDDRNDFETISVLTWRDVTGTARGFDYASNKTDLDRVARARPHDLDFDPMFFIYGQVLDLVQKLEMARHLRVFRINIGFESGSEPTLQHLKGPRDSVAANCEALKLVRDQSIHVYSSFVLGTEMETPEPLQETVDWIKRIIDEDLISDVEAKPILPPYNHHYGNVLFADYVPEGDPDWPVDIVHVVQAAREIRQYAAVAQNNFGSGVSKAENYATA